MKLIGLYDSPYVRRVGVTLNVLGLRYDHVPLSVFSSYEAFAAINPVVKAPSLVTEDGDGVVLLDSSLILDYVSKLSDAGARLSPADLAGFARAQRLVGLALAACEKTVQIVYEHRLRPEDKRHQPWLDRVQGQLEAAYRLLEDEAQSAQPWFFGADLTQADITTAVAFDFTSRMLPEALTPGAHPGLSALSARAEETEPFRACPFV